MRVLVVSDWYPEDPGDPSGSFVRNQALAASRDHEVAVLHLAAPRAGLTRPALEQEQDGPLRTLRLRRPPRIPLTAGNLAATAVALLRLSRQGFQPDILHAHEVGAAFAAVSLGRVRRYPVVVSVHHSDYALGELRRVTARLARTSFAQADTVCPVSADLRERLEAGGWPGRFRVVPNVVDTERFAPPGGPRPEGPARIVAVASLHPIKGIESLVEAAGIVARQGLDFHIDLVGDGPLRARVALRVRELGLDERVTLHGALPPAEVAALMRAATFAVVPSAWETFSVVLGEAMACGLPVVATAVGGMVERVDERNGILVAPGDPDALAVGIAQMLGHHDAYDRAAISATVQERLSPAAVAKRWGEVYEEAAATAPSTGTRRSRLD